MLASSVLYELCCDFAPKCDSNRLAFVDVFSLVLLIFSCVAYVLQFFNQEEERDGNLDESMCERVYFSFGVFFLGFSFGLLCHIKVYRAGYFIT